MSTRIGAGCGPVFFTTGFSFGGFLLVGLILKFWVAFLVLLVIVFLAFLCAELAK